MKFDMSRFKKGKGKKAAGKKAPKTKDADGDMPMSMKRAAMRARMKGGR